MTAAIPVHIQLLFSRWNLVWKAETVKSYILKYNMQIRNEMMHFQIKQSVTSHERIDIQVRHSVISNKRKNFQIKQPVVRFTKAGSVLPLYKIGVLLKQEAQIDL